MHLTRIEVLLFGFMQCMECQDKGNPKLCNENIINARLGMPRSALPQASAISIVFQVLIGK